LDFNEEKFRSEINKSKINTNSELPIEDQLKSAFRDFEIPHIEVKSKPKPTAIKSKPKTAAIKPNPKPRAIKSPTKAAAIKADDGKRTISLNSDIRKLIHRDNSGETLSAQEYFRKVIRQNEETVTLGHLLAEEGKAFTENIVLHNYGGSLNSVAHTMALCKVKQEGFEFTDKETLMLVGAGGNTVAHLIAKSDHIERMSFIDIEIFAMRNDKGESVANLLAANGIKFTHKALDPIRDEIFNIIAA